jgi:hypothetical protein
MNREPAARQLVSPDVKPGCDARIQDLESLRCYHADNMTVAERAACVPGVFAKRNAH